MFNMYAAGALHLLGHSVDTITFVGRGIPTELKQGPASGAAFCVRSRRPATTLGSLPAREGKQDLEQRAGASGLFLIWCLFAPIWRSAKHVTTSDTRIGNVGTNMIE